MSVQALIFVVALIALVAAKDCGISIKKSCGAGKCCSYWGYCGTSSAYCGSGKTQCACDCKGSKPCTGSSSSNTNTNTNTCKYYRYVTASTLNQRTGPGTNYAKSGTLSKGAKVCVVSTQSNWSKLNTGKWVCSDYLSASAPGGSSNNNNNNNNNNNVNIAVKNTKIRDALKSSQWASKADSLAVAYDVVIAAGYSVKCAIGLMANLVAEGNYGIVEYAFSSSHNFGFYLPSGGVKCKTIADINYVKNWTTDKNAGSKKMSTYTLYKGSCGFGSVQWSYDRRVNFAKVCLNIMKKDSDVNDANWAAAEATFIAQELKNGYYNSVANAANNAGGSVEAWAEAFTDKYERPAGADLKMTATGSACITRRKNARDIYNFLSGKGVI